MKIRSKISFANSAEKPVVTFSFVNEINIGADGWAMIAPFGDHPSNALVPDGTGKMKKQKAIQRIDAAGASAMVAQFHNERKGVRKFLRGCNIYVGHPDVPGLEKFYPDHEAKGVIADVAVRADGIYGLPVFTNEGSELVEQKKFRAFSGNIGESEADGEVNGVPAYRPTKLFSVGLTNTPHLPVHFFNSDGSLAEAPTNQNKTMKKAIVEMCAALGIQFANDADDAKTEVALGQVQAKVAAFANEKTAFTAATKAIKEKLVALCAKVGITFANADAVTDPAATLAQVEDKIVTLNADLTTARTQFANERTARITDAIGAAVKSGRITEAEKPTWEGRLKVEAQFANEMTALNALTPKVKTTSVTVNRGGKESQVDVSTPQARTQFINEAITEVAGELKLDEKKDYPRIFNEVQRRHPALFANMQQPEIKVRGSKRN
jgi:Mu-like prophage I protein